MEKLKRNNSGFTLLEIIIVVIIVGVLASLALPRLFSNVEFSRSTEAMAAVGAIRSSMERCLLRNGNGNYGNCAAFTDLDITDQGLNAGSHFTYGITGNGTTGYTILATRNTLEGGVVTSTITIVVDTTSITTTGATAFADL